ncbi:hypothetical protein FDJ47_gp27 [Enterobacter phage Ec_L1]|uniref:Uncharacterized protein n=1 Tax=Enterobacter phage Ec_L1 TaxID=2070180 RepID=A0A2P0W9V2_9CAUD|nr:hypothetical protein FDJ47_gp27 [Enterobacter phage Ec_L1]AUV57141.1 hypothetical protein Ec27 [Enterobacter phage Ec_L1]
MKLDIKEVKKIALEVADLVDVHGWSLSAAKAEFKSRTGGVVKSANSKDKFTNALRKFAK